MSFRTEPAIFPLKQGVSDFIASSGATASARPIALIVSALETRREGDAVRLFLNALAHYGGGSEDLIDMLRQQGGEPVISRLVHAFAKLPCPHCRRGINVCDGCGGSGRADDGPAPCHGCVTLGVISCDFCGGSGFATYSFVPTALRPAVAAVRTDQASQRSAELLAWPLPSKVAKAQLHATRKVLAKELVSLQREVAVLSNAAQFVREHHERHDERRPFATRLFSHIAQVAAPARTRVSVLLTLLGRISHEMAVQSDDAGDKGFEAERSTMFAVAARDAERSAARRTTLFPGHL